MAMWFNKVLLCWTIVVAASLIPSASANKFIRKKNTLKDCENVRCRQLINLNCTYAEYQDEHCAFCKQCTYPPPREIDCPPPTKPIFPLCIFRKPTECTQDQYIEEMCFFCKHCRYLN